MTTTGVGADKQLAIAQSLSQWIPVSAECCSSVVLALVARTGEVDAMSKAKDVLNGASCS